MNNPKLKDITLIIKKKKELSDIPDFIVTDIINEYINKHKISIPTSEKQRRILVKIIRAELRNYVGRFQIKSKNLKITNFKDKKEIEKLLLNHRSTKERIISNAGKILLSEITKVNPKTILDLGCGLNPIWIMQNLNKNINYTACDIKENELSLIDSYFKNNKIKGRVSVCDLRKQSNFPKTDLCLILKVLDIIESKGHRLAHNLVAKVKSKIIIVSFATKTLSGKPMKSIRRLWMESMLKSLKLPFIFKTASNEIFYIIERN